MELDVRPGAGTTADGRPDGQPAVAASPRLRSVAVPSEHGGWSLTAEPVLLGLVVAWSWSGLALGAAAMVAFVARTPLKLVLVDRRRHRWLERSRLAARVVTVEAVVLAALVAFAALTGDGRFWVPLAAAAPLVLVELWYDMRSRSRRLVPELAGTIGIGSVAASIALAEGANARLAVGLWCVVAARSAAALPYVRTQILRGRGRPFRRWHSDIAQAIAVAVLIVGWVADAVPPAAVIAVALVGVANVVAVRARPRRPVVIGVQQMAFGVAVVAITAIAVLGA
jgi:hypothetical protein